MTVDAETRAPGLIERARNMLAQPSQEWERIAQETTPTISLVMQYLAPLAAGVAVAGLIGALLTSGFSLSLVVLIPLLAGAAGQVILLISGLLLWGMAINALAPSFGSEKNQDHAFRLAIYSSTAVLVAGLALILPVLAFMLMIAGAIYSAILLHAGLPSMMKTPEEKRIPFVVTLVGVGLVGCVIGSILYANLMHAVRPASAQMFSHAAPAPDLPDTNAVDLDDLQRLFMQGGGGTTVDPPRLRDQLPPSLPGGFRLQSASTDLANAVARAEGVYRSESAELRLTVMQTGEMEGLASIVSGITAAPDTVGGYRRTQTIDGRIYAEQVDAATSSASYTVVGRGVALSAEGTNLTLDQARAAVDTIGLQRLERQFGT